MRKLLFVGMPGSGKGTQAKLLIPLGFAHISTGEIIREAWKKKNKVVMPYKDHIESGGFLPDKEVFELIDQEISNVKGKGYILDGAIRNLKQAEISLQKNLVDEVFFFELTDKIAKKRLGKRFALEFRKDDSSETIQKRIDKYKKDTKPILNYFKDKGIKIHKVDGTRTIEDIHEEIKRIFGINKNE